MKPLPILALIALAGCGQTRVRSAPVPTELTTCADEPAPPSLPERDGTIDRQNERDIATLNYILGLRSAYGDCRAKVEGVKRWNEGMGV